MTGRREKGRAIFLAAIMVMSMVAMSAAFAGSAAADVDSIGTTEAPDVAVGQEEIDQVVTINDVVEGDTDGDTLMVSLDTPDADLEIVDAEVTESGGYTSADTIAVDIEADGFNVTVPSEDLEGTDNDIDVTVTLNTLESEVGVESTYNIDADEGDGTSSDTFDLTEADGSITGDVMDLSSEIADSNINNVDGATVVLSDADGDEVETKELGDSASEYTFDNLRDGEYTLAANLSVYEGETSATVSDGTETTQNVQIGPDVDVTPDEVVVGETSDIVGDSQIADGDRINYYVYNETSLLAQGSTLSGEFSVSDFDFDEVGTYTVEVETDPDTGIEQSINNTAVIQSGYDFQNVEFDPAEPTFGDELTVSGEVFDADGNPAEGLTVELKDEAGDVSDRSISTDSNGFFQISGEYDDAGQFNLTEDQTEIVYDSVLAGSQDADLTLETEDELVSFSEAEFAVEVTDAADDGIEFENDGTVDGYLNITGPFDADSVSGQTNITETGPEDTDGNVAYIHVETAAGGSVDGTAEFTAIPTGDDVTAALELTANDEIIENGLEDTNGAETPDTLDYVADPVTQDVTPLGEINIALGDDDEITVGEETQSVTVDVTGSDGDAPSDDGTGLKNATVSISGDMIEDQTLEDQTGEPTAEFYTLPQHAGTISVSVEAYDQEEEEFVTAQAEIDVDGLNFDDLTPEQGAVQESATLGADLTRADGTPTNSRVVYFFEASDADQTEMSNDFGVDANVETGDNIFTLYDEEAEELIEDVSVVRINGDEETLEYSTDDNLNQFETLDSVAINNGEYEFENVTFARSATISMEAVRSDEDPSSGVSEDDVGIMQVEAFEVVGVDAFDLESDIDPFLTGSQEQVNITVFEDGERLNGTALEEINLGLEDTDITQSGESIVETGLSFEDTSDEFDGVDAIQTEVNANKDAEAAVNVSVATDGDRFGEAAFDVVEPEITTDLGDDVLTEGVTTEDVFVEATDPRDGSTLGDADLEITATNTSFNVSWTGDTINAGDSEDQTLSADGNVTVDVTPDAIGEDPASLDLAVEVDAGYFGDISVDAAELQLAEREDGQDVDLREEIEFDSEDDITFVLRDANDARLDARDVNVTGAGVDIQDVTDEGFFSVDFAEEELEEGETITFNSSSQFKEDSEITLATVDVTEDLEEVQLDLSVADDTVTQGDDLEFTVTRSDFQETTSAELDFTNASGDSVLTVSTGAVDTNDYGVVDTSELEAGEYTVTADKANSDTKTFLNDEVNVTVEGPDEVALDNVDLDPDTVTPNTTNDHTLTFDALTVSDDSETDTLTVTIPDAATLESANSVNVTDADDETVEVEGLEASDNVITFDVSPDSDADARDLTVEADITVSVPDVEETTEADITIDVADSANGEDSASATLTILPEGDQHPSGVSQEKFNAINADGGDLTLGNLRDAVDEWSETSEVNGVDISLGDLRNVVSWWSDQ